MAKIKHTKNELKAQREALARFERFLPMLQLKKQQLQVEIQTVDARLTELNADEKHVREGLEPWAKLFSTTSPVEEVVSLATIHTGEGNIAGVSIPILKEVALHAPPLDLFETPPWFDDAADTIGQLIRLRAERAILAEQRRLVEEELRVTTQRVNLFEKVKIPECTENIRIIKIFLGDEQTAAVARGKIAKKRSHTR